MSGHLRKKQAGDRVSGTPHTSLNCCSVQVPWFSFRALTSNPRYNLDAMPSGSEKEITLSGLYHRLRELSRETWLYWGQQRKQLGLETMAAKDLNFSPGGGVELPRDKTIYIFRFDTYQGSNKGRIIGYKDDPCAVLHIIGFDIDFRAYDH